MKYFVCLPKFQNSKITWSKAINDWALVLSPEIIWVLTLRSLHFCVLFYQLLRMPRNTRLFFANFTVYFHLVTVFTDHVPILLIEIVVIFLVGFSFITDVRHTLNPRQRWYMDQGRGRTLCDAWHIFCVRIIQRKVTSHPVKKRRARKNFFWMRQLRSLGN